VGRGPQEVKFVGLQLKEQEGCVLLESKAGPTTAEGFLPWWPQGRPLGCAGQILAWAPS
jgi:hypothetical protein